MSKKTKPHKILIDKNLDYIIPYKNEENAINVYGDPIINTKTKNPIQRWKLGEQLSRATSKI